MPQSHSWRTAALQNGCAQRCVGSCCLRICFSNAGLVLTATLEWHGPWSCSNGCQTYQAILYNPFHIFDKWRDVKRCYVKNKQTSGTQFASIPASTASSTVSPSWPWSVKLQIYHGVSMFIMFVSCLSAVWSVCLGLSASYWTLCWGLQSCLNHD